MNGKSRGVRFAVIDGLLAGDGSVSDVGLGVEQRDVGFAKAEDVRSASISARFKERWGSVHSSTIKEIERYLQFLLDLA